MFALTPLLLGAVVSFSGSTVDALTKSLADSTGKNAIIVTSSPHMLGKKFSYDAASADSISLNIRQNTGLVMAPGEAPLFSDQAYVMEHFQPLITNNALPAPGGGKMLAKYIDGGNVTFSTNGGQPVELGSFSAMPWTKPLKIDYLLKDLAVSATVSKMPEKDFLASVAKAAGALFVAGDDGYTIQYDPDQLRIRVVNTLQKVDPSSPLQIVDAKRTFYAASINSLGSDVLMAIFQNPSQTPRLDVQPNSDLASAAVTYIETLESLSGTGGGATETTTDTTQGGTTTTTRGRRAGGNGSSSDLLKRIDNRATVHLRLNAEGAIVLSVPVISGRTSSYIDL